jgi:hypothetical protein
MGACVPVGSGPTDLNHYFYLPVFTVTGPTVETIPPPPDSLPPTSEPPPAPPADAVTDEATFTG